MDRLLIFVESPLVYMRDVPFGTFRDIFDALLRQGSDPSFFCRMQEHRDFLIYPHTKARNGQVHMHRLDRLLCHIKMVVDSLEGFDVNWEGKDVSFDGGIDGSGLLCLRNKSIGGAEVGHQVTLIWVDKFGFPNTEVYPLDTIRL